jgi:hypothetical protein
MLKDACGKLVPIPLFVSESWSGWIKFSWVAAWPYSVRRGWHFGVGWGDVIASLEHKFGLLTTATQGLLYDSIRVSIYIY